MGLTLTRTSSIKLVFHALVVHRQMGQIPLGRRRLGINLLGTRQQRKAPQGRRPWKNTPSGKRVLMLILQGIGQTRAAVPGAPLVLRSEPLLVILHTTKASHGLSPASFRAPHQTLLIIPTGLKE